jgi:4-amino-4-deoxy-L-arabinose transferase-like glycosyltransferase
VRVGSTRPYLFSIIDILFAGCFPGPNIFRLRLFCLPLGAISLFSFWETCSILFPDQHAVRVLAMAFGAFNAQYIFTSSGISNVPMTNLTCAITMYLLLRMITKAGNLTLQSLWAGICFGGALLSRTLTVYLFPVCLIVSPLFHPKRKAGAAVVSESLRKFSLHIASGCWVVVRKKLAPLWGSCAISPSPDNRWSRIRTA